MLHSVDIYLIRYTKICYLLRAHKIRMTKMYDERK
jgi:hypothetical protein